jgi:type IV secretion system protein VirB9
VPAVFHVLGDGSETLVNARMEDDLLVVDRVSRKLMLRAGSAVVGLWNEAFDLDGRPPATAPRCPACSACSRPMPAATTRRLAPGREHTMTHDPRDARP